MLWEMYVTCTQKEMEREREREGERYIFIALMDG
jgi:hypothetical protein